MKKLLVALALIIIVSFSFKAFGARIKGQIYDLELKLVNDTVVEINTKPKQTFISKNGSYFFEVPRGEYELIAKNKAKGLAVKENITVKEEGEFIIDLILLPTFEEFQILEEIEEIKVEEAKKFSIQIFLLPLFILFILISILIFFITRRKRELLSEDLLQILKFIKSEGNRTTQKEIRKALPWSEAKVSLMLDELAAKGYIEKFKKGIGNIVVIKTKGLKALEKLETK